MSKSLWYDPEGQTLVEMDNPAAARAAGLLPVAVEPEPSLPPTQRAVRGAITVIDGVAVLGWEVVAATPEEIQAAFMQFVQEHLDARARERGYDGILSAASYATSVNPRFGPEGAAYRDWRDAVWSHCYQVLADVQASARPVPTEAELIAELPALVLP